MARDDSSGGLGTGTIVAGVVIIVLFILVLAIVFGGLLFAASSAPDVEVRPAVANDG